MSLTVESIMLKYGLDRNKANDIFEKTAQLLAAVEGDPQLVAKTKMLKQAALSEQAKQMLWHIGGGLAGAAAGAVVHSALEGITDAKNRVQRNSNIKQMQAAHPELQNYAAKDLHLAYNTLARMAPSVASDPLLGGQFIKYVVARNDVPIDMLNNISKMGPGGGGSRNYHANIASDVSSTLAGAPKVYMDAGNRAQEMAMKQRDLEMKQEMHVLNTDKAKLESYLRNAEPSANPDGLFDPNQPTTPAVMEARAKYRQNEAVLNPNLKYDQFLAEERAKERAKKDAAGTP